MYESPDSDHLKLIDFGLSKYLGKKASLQRMNSDCGTLYYVAPEVLNKDRLTRSTLSMNGELG